MDDRVNIKSLHTDEYSISNKHKNLNMRVALEFGGGSQQGFQSSFRVWLSVMLKLSGQLVLTIIII